MESFENEKNLNINFEKSNREKTNKTSLGEIEDSDLLDSDSLEMNEIDNESLERLKVENPSEYYKILEEQARLSDIKHFKKEAKKYKDGQNEFAEKAGIINPEVIKDIQLDPDGVWRLDGLTAEEYKDEMGSNDSNPRFK